MPSPTFPKSLPAEVTQRFQGMLALLRNNIRLVIRGKDDVIDRVLICLSSGGHCLIEDLPGLGKTTLAYCLAKSIDCEFSRIQFTSDLLPSDVVGVSIYDEREKAFQFRRGPVFSSIVLADEINRATPKTQSALLEVMDRGKVSVDGQSHAVGRPFMVFATQNPVDFEGTFPLPESQMDRFLMRLQMGYPAYEHELEILTRDSLQNSYDTLQLKSVATAGEIVELQKTVPSVYVEASVADYILRLVTATRTLGDLKAGISTRGTLALKTASQARALLEGRGFVMPEDVEFVARQVFAHRLTLSRHTADPFEEQKAIDALLNALFQNTPKPQ